MWQSTDQTENRSSLGSAASSSMPQPVDPAENSGGNALLAVAPTNAEPADSGNQADAASAQQNLSAPDGATLMAILPPAAGDDSGAAFHFSTAPDVFWFNDDQTAAADQNLIVGGSVAADDQSALVLGSVGSPWDASSELAFTTKLAGLFHDNAPADEFGNYSSNSASSGYLASYSNRGLGDDLVTPPATALPVGEFIVTAPIVSEPSATPTGPMLPFGDLGGGASRGGGSGGGTSSSTVVHTSSLTGGLVINVVYDSSVNNAPAGFVSDVQSVVNYFESHFSNPVTITIDVGYGEVMGQSLGSSALGESITYFDQVSYTQLQNALVANANAIGDSAAAASLPATSPVNGQWWVSTAEAEALGLSSASNNPDGYVGFSSSSNIFAYNGNSIGINQYDFEAVVAHEISEVMGRQMFDGTNAFGAGASYDPLDLFHYSAPGVRDFSGTTPGYASADGGKTSLDAFNTNRSGDFGDWASSAGNDAFDAFANPGIVNAVTQSDLTELNLLGWDPASTTPPPPATPIVTIALASDTGVSATDKITSNDTLTGTADPNAVVKIALGSTVLGNATANASGVWSLTPVALADGQYTVTASETNAAGLTGSASLAFTLDTTAPVVTSDMVSGSGITGGAGLLTAGEIAVFTLALSEPTVISGGLPALVLNDGGTAVYDALHSTGTMVAFDYTVAAGQFTNALAVTGINLNGASVTDVAGNNANLTGADTSFVNLLVDATTPKVIPAYAHDLLGGTVAASAASGVLVGASDANPSDVLSVGAVLGSAANVGHSVTGAFGVLALNANGSYSYSNTNPSAVTTAGGVTEDLFNYTISNGHGGTTDATLSVLITSPNDIYKTGPAGSTLQGGSGNYVLDGSAGNMHLTAGNQGQQWLVGGAGDVLSGGKSADTFMFSPGFGKETINNFSTTHDVIDLPQSMFANFAAVQADMHASGSNTIIMADANDVITLSHMAVMSLHAQNFHFLV